VLRVAGLVLALLVVSCGPKSMSARRANSQKIADQTDEELSRAERAMADLDAAGAQKAIDAARKLLMDPDSQLYPEYEMLAGRLKEDEAKLPDVRKAYEQRELQNAIAKRKTAIDEAAAALKKSLKALDAAALEKSAVEDASKAAADLLDAIKEGQSFEKKDSAYAEWVKAKRDQHEKAKDPIGLAKARVDFMEGPAALREKAAEKLKEGKASKDNAEKRAAFTEAKKLYDKCQDACRKALTANPAISRLPIVASGRKTTPEALDSACTAEWQDVDKAEKKLKPDKPPPPPPKKKK
jgi:hypothetical protein